MLSDAEIGKILRRAYERKIYGGELTMLNAILCNCNDRGECRKSNQDFVKQLGISDRSVTGWISDLKKRGAIGICINSHSHVRIIYVRGLEGKYQCPDTYQDLSPEQKMFKDAFPSKIIDCEVPKSVNMPALISEIKESTFLKLADNMTLKSYVLRKYDRIMQGVYRDDVMMKKYGKVSFANTRNYTKEEMNALFTPIEEIEV